MFTFPFFLSLWMSLVAPAEANYPLRLSNSEGEPAAGADNITWSKSRKLSWSDFKGTPDESNPHHAVTAANLAVDGKCRDNNFSYEVKCVFLPQQSWSKNKASDKLLQHEQLHFDLTEVYARQLRQKLSMLDTSCISVKIRFEQTVKKAFKEWKAQQLLFDTQSRHGLDKAAEQAWAEKIERSLQELEAYQ